MFSYRRRYTGLLRAVVFDWAGTTVDYGCFAPTLVFVEGFRAFGIDITLAEARAPMGLHKRDHIAAVLAQPRVAAAWRSAHGSPATDTDVQRIFDDFVPRQIAVIAKHADLIPGVLPVISELSARGLRIGACTGYTRPMMEALLPAAADQGYAPDVSITPDEVGAGRPAPWMLFEIARRLQVYPMAAVVKVGDTPSDIEEGLNAGAWTVAVAKTGNELGMSAAEAAALSAAELGERLQPVYARLRASGAHYVIDSAGDLLPVIDDIQRRLSAGEAP
jgi:phosphonoacetaldehyde hydrolase